MDLVHDILLGPTPWARVLMMNPFYNDAFARIMLGLAQVPLKMMGVPTDMSGMAKHIVIETGTQAAGQAMLEELIIDVAYLGGTAADVML